MGAVGRAWASFRSRPAAERRRLVRRALQQLRHEGLTATLAWVRNGSIAAHDPDNYAEWCRVNTPDGLALAAMPDAARSFTYRPLISIITAVYNTDPRWLEAAAVSVTGQTYPYWQWSIADDGSTNPGTRAALDRIAALDSRIQVGRAPANGGVSTASNVALSMARGEFVALMDHDDALLPHALHRIVERLNAHEEPPDVVYSDEDKLDEAGTRVDPYFKPDWAPDLFRSSMYACHLLVIRRAILEEVGGFRSAFDFAQDYDLLLRVIERTSRIAHVADVLYHWRKTPASTASSGAAKPTAHLAGARALQAHLDRQAIAGRIEDAGPPGLYRVRYDVIGRPRVSAIVVPVADKAVAESAVDRLRSATEYTDVEWIAAGPGKSRQTFADMVNDAAARATGAHLLVVRADLEPRDPQWLTAMLEMSQRPHVGAVGAKLFDSAGRLSHIGLVLGLAGVAGRPFEGFASDTVGYYSGANCIRNYTAVSAACLMTRREVFDRVGGMMPGLEMTAAAADYGLRIADAGLRVVYTPYAPLTLGEPREGEPTVHELSALRARWGGRLERDPCYNEHLSREAIDYRLAVTR